MQSDSPCAFLRALAHSPPPPSRSPRRYPPRAPASSLAPIIIFLVLPRKAKPLFCPCRAEPSSRGEVAGASRDERAAPRRAGRRATGGGVPRSPECAGSAGEGRLRARQCHGLIFMPISLCRGAPLPAFPGPGAQGEGLRGAVGRSGVAHKPLWRG